MMTVLPQIGLKTNIVTPILEVDAHSSKTNCMAFSSKTSDKIVNRARQALKTINLQRKNSPTAQIKAAKQERR
jgi:hypothetical protein